MGEGLGVGPMHDAGEVQCLAGGNDVAMHHVERIALGVHVEARQRPPRSAHCIEGAASEGAQNLGLGDGLADDLLCLPRRAGRAILEGEAAEREGDAGTDGAALHVH